MGMDPQGTQQTAPEPRPPSTASSSNDGEQRTSAQESQSDSFSLDDAAFTGDSFRMYEFKVKRCPRARPHDWTCCPFAHPGEKAKRRDPRRYRYSGTACPDFRKNGTCRRGDACPFAHGVFECWLHPSRYRTQTCTDGTGCKRRVCFFAHTEAQLRKPEEDSVLLSQQLQAELAAEAHMQQQHQLVQSLTALLAAQGQPGTHTGSLQMPPMEALQNLARQSLNVGDSQNTGTTLQDRARLLQLQLQLNQIQQQQQAQQLLQGHPQQLSAATLSALSDQVMLARDRLLQQQLQQQVEAELRSSADTPAHRHIEALRMLRGTGQSGSPGRHERSSPPGMQRAMPEAAYMQDNSLNGFGLPQPQVQPSGRLSLDSALLHLSAGAQHSGSTPYMNNCNSFATSAHQDVLRGPGRQQPQLAGPFNPHLASGVAAVHTSTDLPGLDPSAVFMRPQVVGQRRSVDLGAIAQQQASGFALGSIGSSMHRASSITLESIGEGSVSLQGGLSHPSNSSLLTAYISNAGSTPASPHWQSLVGGGQRDLFEANSGGALRAQALQQLLTGRQHVRHPHKPAGRYSADWASASTGPPSGLLQRNASFDRILSELPRTLSDVTLSQDLIRPSRAVAGGNCCEE